MAHRFSIPLAGSGASLPLLGSLVLVIVGGWLYFARQDFISRAESTEGRVVQVRLSRRGDDRSYRTSFAFRDAAGTEHRVLSSTFSPFRMHSAGQTVRVLYDPADPSNARIESFWELWASAIGFGVAGLAGMIGLLFVPPETISRLWPQSGSDPP